MTSEYSAAPGTLTNPLPFPENPHPDLENAAEYLLGAMNDPKAPKYAVDVQDAVLPADDPDAKMTPIRKLARQVEWFIWYMFRRAQERGVTNLVSIWNEIILVLAQFDIQLALKWQPQRGHDKIVRYTFFVSHGTPRPMSSFRLKEDYVTFFRKVDASIRVMLTQSFEVNKEVLSMMERYEDFFDVDQRRAAGERARGLLQEPGFLPPSK